MSLPTLIVEIGFGGTPGTNYLQLDDAVRGLLDTGVLAADTQFTDVTADVLSGSLRRGRSRQLESYQAGSCDILLDNTTGDYDPNNLSGLYVSGGVTLVKPMVRVRIRATWNGTTYNLFYGFADSFAAAYPDAGQHSVIRLRATDGFKVLNQYTPSAPSAGVGASEASGTRIGRLLDLAGWPSTDRDLDTGDSTVQATTLAQNVLSECNAVALSEQGSFFMSADGKATFRRRNARLEDTRSMTVQATWDDDGTDLAYQDVVIGNDDELIKNLVSATIEGGIAQTATDSTSVGNFLTRTYTVSSLWLETDTDADRWADWVLLTNKDFESRVERLMVAPASAAATLWPAVLGAEIGDLHLVNRRPAGDDLAKYVFVEGVAHAFSPENWVTTFDYSSASPWRGYLILDDATLGLLDTGLLAGF